MKQVEHLISVRSPCVPTTGIEAVKTDPGHQAENLIIQQVSGQVRILVNNQLTGPVWRAQGLVWVQILDQFNDESN